MPPLGQLLPWQEAVRNHDNHGVFAWKHTQIWQLYHVWRIQPHTHVFIYGLVATVQQMMCNAIPEACGGFTTLLHMIPYHCLPWFDLETFSKRTNWSLLLANSNSEHVLSSTSFLYISFCWFVSLAFTGSLHENLSEKIGDINRQNLRCKGNNSGAMQGPQHFHNSQKIPFGEPT